MGKQAHDRRTALANALNTTGKAVAPPPLKVTASAPVVPRKKEEVIVVAEKTKAEIEAERRSYIEENARQKADFYAQEAAKKTIAPQSAQISVTYVEDKDTRKPKAIGDISEYWAIDLGALPFLPSDNAELADEDSALEPSDVDPLERIEYLQMFSEMLQKLLKLKFNVFWSQMIYPNDIMRSIDSYLRNCLRSHDIAKRLVGGFPLAEEVDVTAAEERRLNREVSRQVLALLVRLSRPKETSHDFFSADWYGQMILEHGIWDVPKLIDVCAIYGDNNREVVTKIMHSVFSHQSSFKDDFRSIVPNIVGGLTQCCGPLLHRGGAAGRGGELSVDDCLQFLPDILSCFNAIFCYFPEDLVEVLLGGTAKESSQPLAELLVTLYDGLGIYKMRCADDLRVDVIRPLLCRLLSLALGFRFAPRLGAGAFSELLVWLQDQHERSEAEGEDLLMELGRNGLDHLAMDWLASGLVDDAHLDKLEDLCGPVLGAESRSAQKRRAAQASTMGTSVSSSSGAQAAPAKAASSSANDTAKIREVREVLGLDYGEGFILQCLLHYGGSVPAVVGGIADGTLPPQLKALPISMKIGEDPSISISDMPQLQRALTSEDKKRIIGVATSYMQRQENEENLYDDDGDDDIGGLAVKILGGNSDESDQFEDDEEAGTSDEESSRWTGNRGKGGKIKGGKGRGGYGKGSGKGGGAGKAPVKGQTIEARRKEENKSAVANHNRRDRHDAKMRKGMF